MMDMIEIDMIKIEDIDLEMIDDIELTPLEIDLSPIMID